MQHLAPNLSRENIAAMTIRKFAMQMLIAVHSWRATATHHRNAARQTLIGAAPVIPTAATLTKVQSAWKDVQIMRVAVAITKIGGVLQPKIVANLRRAVDV